MRSPSRRPDGTIGGAANVVDGLAERLSDVASRLHATQTLKPTATTHKRVKDANDGNLAHELRKVSGEPAVPANLRAGLPLHGGCSVSTAHRGTIVGLGKTDRNGELVMVDGDVDGV